MLGAIVGDVVGSRFEWDNLKSKEFELFKPPCHATDDSVMTIAVGAALLKTGSESREKIGPNNRNDNAYIGACFPRSQL